MCILLFIKRLNDVLKWIRKYKESERYIIDAPLRIPIDIIPKANFLVRRNALNNFKSHLEKIKS